ncbi:MAG TPA: hypothetical protein DDX54_03035 [Rhodospirillaceae bacterium]|jgi:hypothetical protein|nr:hypothetical protein [Rhodospirillaceae bacterium]
MAPTDAALCRARLAAPHVSRWWRADLDAGPGRKLADRAVYRDLLIARRGGQDFGYLQVYDNTATGCTGHPPGVLGLDMFIGEARFLRRGLARPCPAP